VTRWVTAILATALTLGAVAWSVGIYQILELSIYEEQFAAAMLSACLALAFLHLPARHGAERARVPWYDWAAAAVSAAAAAYIAVRYPLLVDIILLSPTDAVVAGAVLSVLLLEALRRATGKALPIIILAFVLYGVFADAMPARWPAIRGNPLDSAHRPLPSMMIATWRGNSPRARRARNVSSDDAGASKPASGDFPASIATFRSISVDPLPGSVRQHIKQ